MPQRTPAAREAPTKFAMKQTWRWFGPGDPVSLAAVRQTGATGVVTALHHIPHGDVWTVKEINKRKAEVQKAGLTWDVIESIPVHESIKTRSGPYRQYIEHYKTSLRNAARCGIRIVTYNFMPVNDWTRTSLDFRMPDGSLALYFDWTDLAIFDRYILRRQDAEASYPLDVLKKAAARYRKYGAKELRRLSSVVMFGIPGESRVTLKSMREKLAQYRDIDAHALRENLSGFQHALTDVCGQYDVKMALHPDDPPFPILGLPRVVSTAEDLAFLFGRVDAASNGLCFCTGSLGASATNDLPAMIRRFGDRVHFIHLRDVRKDAAGNFFEADHLDGDQDMYRIVKELLLMQQRRRVSVPFRPDHGHRMLDDLHRGGNPGYSAIGRLRGLAELRGLETGILRSL